MKKKKKLQARINKTNKAVLEFISKIFENYKSMKKKIKKTWLPCAAVIATTCITLNSCNITRTITTQSEYYTRGDTTCTIITKTIESYDASKKGVN